MTNHDAAPATPEVYFNPEPVNKFHFGEIIISADSQDGDEPTRPIKFLVSGGYVGDASNADTGMAYYYFDAETKYYGGVPTEEYQGDTSRPKLMAEGTVTYHEFHPPLVSTGQRLTLTEVATMLLQERSQVSEIDLKTYTWDAASSNMIMGLVEQNIADRVARGEEVTPDELAINQERRVRLATPGGPRVAYEAKRAGTFDYSPYIKAFLAQL